MNCPKCKAAMNPVKFQEFEVDRCTRCGGLWFDMLEAEDMARLKGAESVDSGPSGKKVDRLLDSMACPSCKSVMTQLTVADQPHIHYEACGRCYGIFLDAGEFRDFKEKTFAEFLRRLTKS